MFIITSGSFIDLIAMSHTLTKLIVCLTGMPGSGKSTIADGLKPKGYETISMGDAVRKEAERRGLKPSRLSLGRLMLELREKNGPGAIAELIRDQIDCTSSNVILIDGVRSGDEIDVLRKFGKVKLLAIHASIDTRFDFLQKRGRLDDPRTKADFEERDNRELRVGISNPIALSDHAISNIGMSKDELISTAFKIIQSWT